MEASCTDSLLLRGERQGIRKGVKHNLTLLAVGVSANNMAGSFPTSCLVIQTAMHASEIGEVGWVISSIKMVLFIGCQGTLSANTVPKSEDLGTIVRRWRRQAHAPIIFSL